MNPFPDSLIILITQLLLFIGFISLTKYWLNKKNNVYPVITYWVLGLFFVLLMASNFFNWFLSATLFEKGSLLRDKDSINTMASVLGIGIYLIIGITFFKRKVTTPN